MQRKESACISREMIIFQWCFTVPFCGFNHDTSGWFYIDSDGPKRCTDVLGNNFLPLGSGSNHGSPTLFLHHHVRWMLLKNQYFSYIFKTINKKITLGFTSKRGSFPSLFPLLFRISTATASSTSGSSALVALLQRLLLLLQPLDTAFKQWNHGTHFRRRSFSDTCVRW